MMHLARIWSVFILVFIGGACGSSYTVFHDQDPQADFGEIKSYRLVYAGSDQPRTELTRKHIEDAIHELMKNRGYALDSLAPDMVLAYDGRVQRKTQIAVENSPSIYGPQWGYYGWDNYQYREYEYSQGTLVIDFVSPDNKQLLWQGGVVASVKEEGATYEQIRKVVQAIFMKYPYISGSNQKISPGRARTLSSYKEDISNKDRGNNSNKVGK